VIIKAFFFLRWLRIWNPFCCT